MKKFFLSVAVLLSVSLFLIGCPTDPESGVAGAPGSVGTTQLSANITAASLQGIVDRGGPILISGSVEIGAGYVDLKGASITVDGALTFASDSFVNARSAKVAIGAGSIDIQNAVIFPPAGTSVWDSAANTGSSGKLAPLVSVADFAAAAGSGAYAVQDVTVDASGNIGGTAKATVLGSKTVYILGTLTNADATLDLSTATGVKPLGSISSSANIKLAATTLLGNLTVTGAATLTTTNAVDVKGTLTTGTGAVTLGGNLTVGGNAVIGGALAGPTSSATITFNGATASIASYTAKAVASKDTFAGKAVLTIGTLTDIASESEVVFNGPTTVTKMFTPGTSGAIIAGSGAVTFTAALGATTDNNVTVKNTGGVTLTAKNTIATNIDATKVTIKGSDTGVIIDSDAASITVNASESITVPADGGVVAGGTTDKVTITGATLKPGTYTGTTGKLALSANTEIEVADNGAIEIAGTGDLNLTESTSKVVLNAGGAIDVKAATGKFGEATQTETKVTVGTAANPSTATKAAVVKADTVWTVTTDAAGTDISAPADKIILGTFAVDFAGTSNVDVDPCIAATADSKTAAAGKLVAGAGTAITFIGTD
ncbi:MAG: hypothetical protein LBG27_02655 [Spirochaetaceae bacterium]|jgi:hypothetical protein|nr:hypothetical protein [Spirochaetaceae bacterium]